MSLSGLKISWWQNIDSVLSRFREPILKMGSTRKGHSFLLFPVPSGKPFPQGYSFPPSSSRIQLLIFIVPWWFISLQNLCRNLHQTYLAETVFSQKSIPPPPLCKNGDGVETESYVILLIGSVIGFVNRFHCYRSKELPYSPISFYLRFWVYWENILIL